MPSPVPNNEATRFKKGNARGGNALAGLQMRMRASVAAKLQEYGPERAIELLWGIAESATSSPSEKIAAVKVIFEYGMGRPDQNVNVNAGPARISVSVYPMGHRPEQVTKTVGSRVIAGSLAEAN